MSSQCQTTGSRAESRDDATVRAPRSRNSIKATASAADEEHVRATRAYLAGLGTAGTLVLAASILFVFGSAVVTYNGWPKLGGIGSPATQTLTAHPKPGSHTSSHGLASVKVVAPRVARATAIFNPETHSGQYWQSIEAAAPSLAVKFTKAPVRGAADQGWGGCVGWLGRGRALLSGGWR